MRTRGKVTHWNGEKGYGFITPEAGAKQVFVHISALRNRAGPPVVGQLVTFDLSTDKQGRPRAEDVVRDGEPPPKPVRRRNHRSAWGNRAVLLLIVILVAAVGYSRFRPNYVTSYRPAAQPAPADAQRPGSASFRCDGRTRCNQMTSCAEARYFNRNCPNTQMDGDHDGVPCESQWCN